MTCVAGKTYLTKGSYYAYIMLVQLQDGMPGVLRFGLVGGVPLETQNPYPYLGVIFPELGGKIGTQF